MIQRDEFTCPKCGGHQYTTYDSGDQARGHCLRGQESMAHRSCGFEWPRSQDDRYFRVSPVSLLAALWEIWSSVPAGQIGRAEEWEAIGELLHQRES